MTISTLPRHALTGVLAVGWRKARTGEDPNELFPIWPVLGGSGEGDDQDDADADDDEDDDTGSGADDDQDDDADDDGAADLGDKGKQALARMKARLKAEKDRRRAVETERDQLKTAKAGDDQDPERIRNEAEQAATARANGRIVRSELKAAAKGKLADPKDALVFLDASNFEVDDDGQVDEDEMAEAIEQLLKDKPHLAAATAKRFQGSGDGGARKGSGGVEQLGKKDLKTMTAEQIEAARVKGQLRDYLRE